MTGRKAALLHGGGGQGRKPDHIAGGIDVFDCRLIDTVNLETTALVRLEASGDQVEFIRSALTTNGLEERV